MQSYKNPALKNRTLFSTEISMTLWPSFFMHLKINYKTTRLIWVLYTGLIWKLDFFFWKCFCHQKSQLKFFSYFGFPAKIKSFIIQKTSSDFNYFSDLCFKIGQNYNFTFHVNRVQILYITMRIQKLVLWMDLGFYLLPIKFSILI